MSVDIEAIRARCINDIIDRWPGSPLAKDVNELLAEIERLNDVVNNLFDESRRRGAEIVQLREALAEAQRQHAVEVSDWKNR